MRMFHTGVQAGFPSPADDWLEEEIDLNQYLGFGGASTYLVKVEGDSMRDAGIVHGVTLMIDRALKPGQGDIVLAVWNGEFTIRTYYFRAEKVILYPAHPDYRPAEIGSDEDFEVWGVVTYCLRQYNI